MAARVADTAGADGIRVCMVLNTDNFNITGESLIMGRGGLWTGLILALLRPISSGGRYAFGRQPEASLWVICRPQIAL